MDYQSLLAGDVWRVGMGKRPLRLYNFRLCNKKARMFKFYCWYKIYKSGSSQQFMSYSSAFNTHGFKIGFKWRTIFIRIQGSNLIARLSKCFQTNDFKTTLI